jgi:hypothetical protein
MVARTRSEAALVVIFQRDGERDDAWTVPNGERAAVTAVLMIAGRGVLHAGAISCSCSTTKGRNLT